jgi:hypothetical protein
MVHRVSAAERKREGEFLGSFDAKAEADLQAAVECGVGGWINKY